DLEPGLLDVLLRALELLAFQVAELLFQRGREEGDDEAGGEPEAEGPGQVFDRLPLVADPEDLPDLPHVLVPEGHGRAQVADDLVAPVLARDGQDGAQGHELLAVVLAAGRVEDELPAKLPLLALPGRLLADLDARFIPTPP